MALRYVALGSSFAAGPGIDPILDERAGRSGSNYAHLVARELDLDLVDVTCSGATTDDLLRTAQRVGWRRHVPPQLDAVGPDTDLVTITVGGNDVGYLGSLAGTTNRQRLLDHLTWLPEPLLRRLSPSADELPSGDDARAVSTALVQVVEAVRTRAPDARVLLVPYLTILGSAPTGLPLTGPQDLRLRGIADGLADAFGSAAAAGDAELVPVPAASLDHGLGSAEPWVTGFGRGVSAPFHPNRAGMVAVAALVCAHLRA